MKLERNTIKYIDWTAFLTYILIVCIGWIAIYSVGFHNAIEKHDNYGLSIRSIKQGVWFIFSIITFIFIINIDSRIYQTLAYIFYFLIVIMLIGTSFIGIAHGGHSSWYKFKIINLQPTEFAKLACAMALAKYSEEKNINLSKLKHIVIFGLIIGIPMLIILLQGDLGSAIVFGSFIIVAYREGFSTKLIIYFIIFAITTLLTLIISKLYLIIGIISLAMFQLGTNAKNLGKITKILCQVLMIITLIISIDIIMYKVLKPHQQNRIKALINPNIDPRGISWNVTQSKIAIGSGGLCGKGFLKGPQTQFGFVPAQETDFIFSNIGEEYGWFGSVFVILLFIILLNRIINIAERQKSRFERVYGYSVFAIIAFHFIINIGMTIGLAPVIGIPLPLITYGGSSLYTFSVMLFILMKMDAERLNYLSKRDREIRLYS